MAEKSDWSKLKPSEVEKLIVELGEKKIPPEKIGLILRDQHGIPKVKLFKLKINKVLAKHNLAINSEKKNIETKIERLGNHFAKNKHDYKAQHKKIMYTSHLNKIKKLSA